MTDLYLADSFIIANDEDSCAFEFRLLNPAHPIMGHKHDVNSFAIEELASENGYHFDVAMARQLYAWIGTAIELHDQAIAEVHNVINNH